MPGQLTGGWKKLHIISMFTAPGSWVGLKLINDKELLPWLTPDMKPLLGFPLLIILLVSCLFGVQGLIMMGGKFTDRIKEFSDLEKKYKELDRKAEDDEN